jgi:hypothetical protein
MGNHCYYCGAGNSSRPLQISPSFTAGGLVKVPHSNVMCDRCHGIMFGDVQRVWYHNKDEDRWVSLYLRGVHQVWQGDHLLKPELGDPEEHTQVSAAGKAGKPETYRVLSSVPKRTELREWITNPPEPPFTIAIAESGQKHILFLAQTGYDRENFPVQFEMDTLAISRTDFVQLLNSYEDLLALGFSKTELDSGEYRSDRILNNIAEWQRLDPAIARHRSAGKPSRLLQLISFVATKPEYKPPEKLQKTSEIKPMAKQHDNTQLALF